MGDFDLPAQVKYVLEQSGQKKLTYVGLNQGNTQAFYALT